MENNEKNTMTREEAASMLEQVLRTLAQNAVHNKRLTDYADELERYIAFCDAQAAREAEAKPEEATTDEPKAE